MKKKAIIWDWGRTLFDAEEEREFPDAAGVLDYCKKQQYRMVLVSLAKVTPLPKRTKEIENSPLRGFFERTIVVEQSKKDALEYMVSYLRHPRKDVWVIGDRVKREIAYAKHHGHPTVWKKSGRYASEQPNSETGQPDYIIQELEELYNIL